MSEELRPGMFTGLFAEVAVAAQVNSRRALLATALAVEREAKLNVGRGGTHKYGTPTPASPGGPPALISGTLRRSITHTDIKASMGGWQIQVGPASGVFPPYPKKGKRTRASLYGYYLETGLRDGSVYPWLLPAAQKVMPMTAGISATFFRGPWPKI